MKKKYLDAINKINCALPLDRQVVGVRFLFTKEEFDSAITTQPKGKMPYCKMVTNATTGRSVKVNFDNFGCFASARALGIVALDDFYTAGHYYGKPKLYQDYPTAREVTNNISILDHQCYGVEVRPLKEFDLTPHIVIIVSTPVNIMRMVQGYTYKYGTHKSYKFIGNQAMCAESTAHPYKENSINISLLCSGARKSGLNDDELSMGLPLTQFVNMVDGLCETITPVETNKRKKTIEENFEKEKIKNISIEYNKNYSDGMYTRDLEFFKDQRKLN